MHMAFFGKSGGEQYRRNSLASHCLTKSAAALAAYLTLLNHKSVSVQQYKVNAKFN